MLLSALLTGCSGTDPAVAMLAEYEARMARVLDVAIADRPLPAMVPWPRRRERHFDVADQRTGLGGFLSLHRCDLGSLIGERSSQLGRVMSLQARLFYEHRFLLVADRCLSELQGDADASSLLAELGSIVAEKRRQLPMLAFNATLGSTVLAEAHSTDVAALSRAEAEEGGRAETAALYQLANRLPDIGRRPMAQANWDEPYATLARSRWPGRLRLSAQWLTHHLDGAAALLEARQAQRPVCPQGVPTPDAEILWNIFRGYYGERVQPYLVAVDRGLKDWRQALDALLSVQQVEPPVAFEQDVFGSPAALWPALDRARGRHVEAWRGVLGSCGLLPGGQPDSAAGVNRDLP